MNYQELFDQQQAFFASGVTQSVDFRLHQLQTLYKMLKQHEDELHEAVYKDFRKPEFESYATEIGIVYNGIAFIQKKLKKWAKPSRVRQVLINFPSTNYTVAQPYGTVLVMSPWNYPIQLALMPLIGAIAAGNTVILKPSEHSPHTSAVLANMISSWFKKECIAVAEGDVKTNQALLELPFDYLFFTGSTHVGKIVMKAAAEHLTPLTLELGGKSPCIVDETADLETAAKRIAWGKFLNAGQTCVAPDYLLIHQNVQAEFLEHFKKTIRDFYGVNPELSPDYARIINQKHFERLSGYLNDGNLYTGGSTNPETFYIEPTVLTGIPKNAAVMEEEIFGPILPVFSFEKLSDAIEVVNNKPKPLALYVFSENKDHQEQVLTHCTFGGGAVNDVIAHLGNHHLPFGGVGYSGMGRYHGRHSFETFSYQKSIMKKPTWLDAPFRYPPYKGKLKWIKRVLK